MVVFLGIFAIVILFFIAPDFTFVALLITLAFYFWYIAIPIFIIWLVWKGLTLSNKEDKERRDNPCIVSLNLEDTTEDKVFKETYEGEEEINKKLENEKIPLMKRPEAPSAIIILVTMLISAIVSVYLNM